MTMSLNTTKKLTQNRSLFYLISAEPLVVHCKTHPEYMARHQKYTGCLVGPNMYKSMPIPSIDFIPFFIIEQGCDILQSFLNRTSDVEGIGPCSGTDSNTRIISSDFGEAFPSQNIAYIDRTNCRKQTQVRHEWYMWCDSRQHKQGTVL